MADEELRRRWRNWSGEQRCRPLLIQRPRTREGLIADAIAAKEQDRLLKVAGAGHSFSAAALTDGVMLDLGLLDRILEVDRSGGLVKVEAGITLHELNRRLDQLGLALENLGDIDRQTIAGAISTGTHGTGARFRNLSSQVEAMEIVTADGTLHAIDGGDADLLACRPDRPRRARRDLLGDPADRPELHGRAHRSPRPLGEVLERLDASRRRSTTSSSTSSRTPRRRSAAKPTRTQAPAQPPSPASVYAQEVIVENWVPAAFVADRAAACRRAIAGAGAARRRRDREGPQDGPQLPRLRAERRVRFTEMEYAIPRGHAARGDRAGARGRRAAGARGRLPDRGALRRR